MRKVVLPVISRMSPEKVVDSSIPGIVSKPFIIHIEADVLAVRHTEYLDDSSKNFKEYYVSFEVQIPFETDGPMPDIAPSCMKHCQMWVSAGICNDKGMVA